MMMRFSIRLEIDVMLSIRYHNVTRAEIELPVFQLFSVAPRRFRHGAHSVDS